MLLLWFIIICWLVSCQNHTHTCECFLYCWWLIAINLAIRYYSFSPFMSENIDNAFNVFFKVLKRFWVLSVTGKTRSSHHNDREPIIVLYMLVRTDPWMPAGASPWPHTQTQWPSADPSPQDDGERAASQNISAAFYRHGLLCASYPRFHHHSLHLCQHPDLLVSLQSWYLIQAESNGIGARFKLIRDTVAARPKFWCPLSMLKYFMYFCGLGKAAYLYKSVGGMFFGWERATKEWSWLVVDCSAQFDSTARSCQEDCV